jgi:hypothetical protein
LYHRPELNLTPEEILDYLRKSQSDDPLLTVEEVLAKHESILDEWAEKHLGAPVPEKNKFREVVSGETIKERPEINKVLRLIESPKYKAVKVVEPQRLTRGDLEDIGRLMKLLKLTNTLVITPERIYDLRDEYDWNAFEAELKRGNDYLKYTKKILNRGRLLSVSQGNYIASIPPYGYEKIKVMDGKKKCPTLKIKEDEAEVVRMIFDMYVHQDLGRPTIAKKLDEMKIKPPKGEYWSPAGLKDLLENVHYLGKVKWNWRKTIEVVEDGEIRKASKKSKIGEYLIYDGKHEAIINDELFEAAMAKQGRRHRAKVNTKVRNPFASLLWCKCGRAMTYRTYKQPDGSERSPARLICENQARCKTGSALFTDIHERVCSVLESCIADFEVRVKNDEGDSAKLHARLIKNLEQKKKELEAKELAQWEAQADPDPAKRMPPHIFQQLNEKLLREKEEVQQALCKAYESMPDPVDYEEKIVTFSAALSALRDPNADPEKQNKLLKKCIERMEYTREKPQRIKSQQVKYYDPELKKTRHKSPLPTGGNWTSPPIELDVKLRV